MDTNTTTGRSTAGKINPEDRANFISRWTFWWITPMMYSVYKRGVLSEKHVTGPSSVDESRRVTDIVQREWKKNSGDSKISLLHCLYKGLVRNIMWSISLGFMYATIPIIQPFLVTEVIKYLSGDPSVSARYAYSIGCAVVLLSFIQCVVNMVFQKITFRLGMQLRVGLAAIIFEKLLSMTLMEVREAKSGNILTLMSTDLETVCSCMKWPYYVVTSPVTVPVIITLLYLDVGPSVFAGIFFIISSTVIVTALGPVAEKTRERMANFTGERLKLMNEIIRGMNVVKMYCWEKLFANVISKHRSAEIGQARKLLAMNVWLTSQYMMSARLAGFISVITFFFTGGILTPGIVIRMMWLIEVCGNHSASFCLNVIDLSVAYKSVKRVEAFLRIGTIKSQTNVRGKSQQIIEESDIQDFKNTVHLRGFNANWNNDDDGEHNQGFSKDEVGSFHLRDISFTTQIGDLVVILGPVGAGKTSLLLAILGHMRVISGVCVTRNKSLSYVAQEPWIFSDTVQNNILFGEALNIERYHKVVKSCCLEQDISQFPDGDQTRIGERGLTLSGGQKSRINLARAMYEDKDVYLLDDPLSAVDKNVGDAIIDKCINGMLSSKTRLLVTHHVKYASFADKVIVMDKGSINYYGPPQLAMVARLEAVENTSVTGHKKDVQVKSKLTDEPQEEEVEHGSVSSSVYWNYINSGRGSLVLALLYLLVAIPCQVCYTLGDWSLSEWAENNENIRIAGNHSASENNSSVTHIRIYSGLFISYLILELLRSILILFVSTIAARNLHDNMFSVILKGHLTFFERTPIGIVLNRFSRDLGLVDIDLAKNLFFALMIGSLFLGFLVFSVVILPWMLIAAVPYLLSMYVLRWYCLKSGRVFKRLEAVARSPIYSHLSVTMDGHQSIKASGKEGQVLEKFHITQNTHTSAYSLFINSYMWMGLIVGVLTTLYLAVILVTAFCVALSGTINGTLVGFVVLYNVTMIEYLQFIIPESVDLENAMTAVERILMYMRIPQEDSTDEGVLPENWPSSGRISFEQVNLTYHGTQATVLKNLSFTVMPNEKIGIIGRTGAGKSSIFRALLRLVDFDGDIYIDHHNIKSIPLPDIRRNISVIPQDPVLYSGSLRYNLDPFEEFPDTDIWHSLDLVQLGAHVRNLSQRLDTEAGESGCNFSVGEKQLLCLSRALLRHNKIIIIDEATANVDHETDRVIHKTIKEQFRACTVLIIAHRLDTIRDTNRTMVISEGRLLQFEKTSDIISGEDQSPQISHITHM